MRYLAVALGVLLAGAAHAGVYSDDMGKCLVSATSQADKTNLVRWIFATAALHPEVASIASVSQEERGRMDRDIAALFERLVTEDCREEAREAIRYEGMNTAFESSFALLGKVAMQELMTDPNVSAGFDGFTKYLDEQKFEALGSGGMIRAPK
jgi:hypothetical protein